ncbi:Origin recognition complex, subunit 2 [Ophiocordyceps sinensis CO18]|uniref:Origin recognition complex subunit 2 n=1 Tax=Ophiocordyceps sinensis (strain Co18 / CGMCC 3.14243) TaxID=911162 RepID=T5A4J7_OPHSC|nr:Origin recognition complex, subunit 2 [Ophiocordyceps sinensis CO18]
MREILGCIGAAVDATQRIPASTPPAMVHNITTLLSSTDLVLTVMVNSIDATPLRKPGMQAILAQLAAHPQVNLVCSADTPDFPLLWDVGVRSAFNFGLYFTVILREVLVAMEEEGSAAGQESAGVEYRMVYNKAVEEFICTSEMAFRTLLKEFHDHQIITSRKDVIGTELLSVPFAREELEAMLEDLMA